MRLEGYRLVKLMRQNGVTIRELAARMQISMKRVREVRTIGVGMPVRLDFEEAIVGQFTPRHRAMLNQWRASQAW